MPKFILSLLLAGLLLFCFSQSKPDSNSAGQLKAYHDAENIYHRAERLAAQAGDNENLQAKADEMYQEALAAFVNLIPTVEKTGNDSLSFFILLRTGFIRYFFDSVAAAKKDYLAIIVLKQRLASVPDSFLFIPLLYTGGIYYTQNQFDSALAFYKKAETVNDNYKKPLAGSGRLYNRLGVMYYETGNYRQARNYFEKAITLTNPAEASLLVNYKINIASLLVKLEDFKQAQTVYESLLPATVFTNEIYHNLGIIRLKLEDNKKALAWFRKVNYGDNKKNTDLYYNFAMAYASLDEADSSRLYLQKALAENLRWNGSKKNSMHGLILKHQADELFRKQQYKEAIGYYQQAIIQFSGGFQDSSRFSNPVNYTGIFSYINLFNTLTAKAGMFEALYRADQSLNFLTASLDAYHAAFALADYVEQTYDSDEARMFLNKIKHTVHSQPISISTELYDKTQDNKFLEQAYLFDQQNKASILSLNVRENELRNTSGSLSELFSEEASVKSSITRLSIKASQITDHTELGQINASIRDHEIRLSKLHEKMNEVPEYRQKRSISRIPSVNEIRRQLDNTSAVLSYHLSGNELVTLVISREKIDYAKLPINDTFYSKIDSLKTLLHDVRDEQRYTGNAIAGWLYHALISPIIKKLSRIDHLIIIPDDELHYLPFETLMDENKKYLLERFSVHYQFSTSLLFNETNLKKAVNTLAFAPFAAQSFENGTGMGFSKLPFSKEEVSELKGKIFMDSAATKSNFLLNASQYNIIHLATHASINNEDPLQSYIAFYPALVKNSPGFLLYAREIYNMNLGSAELIILSACETGKGKLIKGEGLMSLSRAFAYAGCSNIITSLWKAEDQATSFVAQRLHYYLGKKLRKDKALQLAKLDLLNSNTVDPRLKSPTHWSHLIYIGQYIPEKSSRKWWWFAAGIILLGSLVHLFRKKKSYPHK